MSRRRWLNPVLIAALAIASVGAGLAAAAPPAGPGDVSPAFIEPELQAVLQSQGQANLFVMFREQANLSAAYGMPWEQRGQFVYEALQQTAERSQAKVRADLDAQRIPYQWFAINNSIYIPNAGQMLAGSLLGYAEVSYLRLERLLPLPEPVTVAGSSPAPEATTAWGLTDTKATSVWALGYKGAGIKVSSIDTGVQYNHPALDQSFACPGAPNNPACWYDPGNYCGSGGACDDNGHGTHTMGTMVGDDDSTLSYIVGMAPDATWIACKGCGSSSCSDSDLTACANWILSPGGNTANRPNVVNNSWGGGGGDTWYQSYVTAWRAAGIFPAFSAGNSGSSCSTLGSPGDYQESFASAAHDSSRTIASFSSRGPSAFGHSPYTKPNISAPGVNVCSSVPTNGWSCTYSGTSMASPHTAGAVALLWQACPSYKGNIDGTFQLLQSTANTPPAGNCSSPGDGGNYTYGYGYLDVLAAVQTCAGGPTPTPTNTTTPPPVRPILLVDDDTGSAYETYFTAALNSLGRSYDTWTVYTQGSPSAATLQQHQVVIWFTGNDYSTTLTTTDITNLTTYLNGGGKLFITGQDIGYDINTNAFYGSYLHASFIADDTNVTTLTGVDIMAGADVTISGGDGANNQTYPSAIGLGSGAVGLYDYTGSAYTWGALRWQGTYRVVYFAFGFEGISTAATRASVMDKVLAWLEGGAPPPSPTATNTPTPGPTATPTPTPTSTPIPPPGSGTIWLSLATDATLSLGTVADEDIVALNRSTGAYSWVFDGSDVGITTDVDAFDLLPNGHILMSFDATTSVPGVGTIYDPDIVEFTPTSLGSNTAGTFTWKFDASDVGLSSAYEDVDALYYMNDGTMIVSIRDIFSVTGISGQDEDLIRFTATSWGSTTTGTWSWYFDGSDVGLSTSAYEDVDGLWVNQAITPYPDVYLSTLGTFSVTGLSGENDDIFVFHPTSLGSTTAGTFGPGLYLDGSLNGLSAYDVDAFDIQP